MQGRGGLPHIHIEGTSWGDMEEAKVPEEFRRNREATIAEIHSTSGAIREVVGVTPEWFGSYRNEGVAGYPRVEINVVVIENHHKLGTYHYNANGRFPPPGHTPEQVIDHVQAAYDKYMESKGSS